MVRCRYVAMATVSIAVIWHIFRTGSARVVDLSKQEDRDTKYPDHEVFELETFHPNRLFAEICRGVGYPLKYLFRLSRTGLGKHCVISNKRTK